MVSWLANEPLCTRHSPGAGENGWLCATVTADSVAIRVCPAAWYRPAGQPEGLGQPHRVADALEHGQARPGAEQRSTGQHGPHRHAELLLRHRGGGHPDIGHLGHGQRRAGQQRPQRRLQHRSRRAGGERADRGPAGRGQAGVPVQRDPGRVRAAFGDLAEHAGHQFAEAPLIGPAAKLQPHDAAHTSSFAACPAPPGRARTRSGTAPSPSR